MIPLFVRFPGLRAVAHAPLLDLPTPVAPLDSLTHLLNASTLHLKRNDQGEGPFGGGKLRQLEFHLGEAVRAGASAVLTSGTAGSNHVLATTLAAGSLGLKVTALLIPQPASDLVRRNLILSHRYGAELIHHEAGTSLREDGETVRIQLERLRAEGHRVHLIPFGGSGPHGILGQVNAGLELAGQISAGRLPEPERIYVAAAFGGTAAGLVVGLRAAGISSHVVAVRVVDRSFLAQPQLLALARATHARLRTLDPGFPGFSITARDLTVRHGFAGAAYGRTTAAGTHAARLLWEHHGVALDGCYTAKAFAAMLSDAQRSRFRRSALLFWHTGIGCDLSGELADADHRSLPFPLHRYFTP